MSPILQKPKSIITVSLCWKIPLNLNKTIKFIIALVKACYHCFPGSFFLECVQTHSEKTKKCNQEGYQKAPVQGPNMPICRVICLLSIFVIANGIVDHDSRSLPESVRWLHKAYNYNDYARLCQCVRLFSALCLSDQSKN